MTDKKLNDLANKMEEQYGRNGVVFTAEDYDRVKHPELPKHDAKLAMEQYTKLMHDTEGIDWNKVIASQTRKESTEGKRFEGLKDELRDFRLEITTPPTISNNIPMPVDGGYEDNDKGFDDLGYDCH